MSIQKGCLVNYRDTLFNVTSVFLQHRDNRFTVKINYLAAWNLASTTSQFTMFQKALM